MNKALDQNRHNAFKKLLGARKQPVPYGITSICSAHPLVIEATLLWAARENHAVLIEATCNQVNQDGGYTGMTPIDFRRFIEAIAKKVSFPVENIIFGGDHLGPNPWRKLSAEAAMEKAEAMVVAYVEAGFEKLHLDTSMGCAGEPTALADALTAERASRLARAAEDAASRTGKRPPVYIIGTEVPPPGGATHALEELAVTAPQAALETLAVHRAAFQKAGVEAALERVIGIVVQPGVEFGNANVILYAPEKARNLAGALDAMPGLVFEAHSTDYQTEAGLSALVDDGFAILKVGPGLTFALREALYGLDKIAALLSDDEPSASLYAQMEALMLDHPEHWKGHYSGSPQDEKFQRHFSYSDRIRYYWPDEKAASAVDDLFSRLPSRIAEPLISQYLAKIYPQVVTGHVRPEPRELCLAAITAALDPYAHATASRSS